MEMDKMLYKEDLEYLYSKLVKHPLFVIQESERRAFDKLFCSIINNETINANQFTDAINKLTGFFQDGHTNMELPYSSKDKAINISCDWHNEKLLLSQPYMGIACNAEITAIENVPVEDIITYMAARIPHENRYLVKSRMIHYPYKNYHIFSQLNLEALFGPKDCYVFSFVSEGQTIQKEIRLEQYNGYLDFAEENFVYYEMIEDTAILHLDACICNDCYKSILNQLVDICAEKNITVLILDLSKNMGGNSAVIDEFIRYTNIDMYRRYEMINYSKENPEYITKRTDLIKNIRHEKCFDVEIQCHVSHDTFSSARTFAVTLKDNGIVTKISGMPTGGKPNSFGMPQRFKTPNYQVPFRVSRCLFLRPNIDGDDDEALFPDSVYDNNQKGI